MFLSLCDVVAENDVCQLEKKTKTQTLISLHLKKKKKGWDGNLMKDWKKENHDLINTANGALLAFASVHLCEVPFSATMAIKTKYQNTQNIETDLQITVSRSVKLRFSKVNQVSSITLL